MMNKQEKKRFKALWYMLALIVAIALVTGCQPKLTAKQTLEKISQISMLQNQMGVDFEGKMDMDFTGEVPPEAEAYMGMLKNITFNGHMDLKETDKLADMAMKYTVNLNGLSMEIEAYFDGEQVIIKYPVLPQYIVLNIKTIIEEGLDEAGLATDINYDTMISDLEGLSKTWVPGFYTKMMAGLDESTLTLHDAYSFTFEDKTVTSKAVEVSINAQQLKNLIGAALDQTMESREVYDLIKKYDTENAIESFETYQEQIKTAKDEIMAELDSEEALKALDSLKYTYVIGFDKKYKPTYMAANMSLAIDDEMTDMNATVNMTANYRYVYDDIVVTMPELNEQNSLTFEDLMGNTGMLESPYDGESYEEDGDYTANDLLWSQVDILDQAGYSLSDLEDLAGVAGVLEAYGSDPANGIISIYFADTEGNITLWPEQELPSGYDPRERPWYQNAIEYYYDMPEPYSDGVSNQMIQTVSKSIEVDGAVIGVLGIDFIAQ